MGIASSSSFSTAATNITTRYYLFPRASKLDPKDLTLIANSDAYFLKPKKSFSFQHHYSPNSPSLLKVVPLRCDRVRLMMETTQEGSSAKTIIDFDVIDEKLVQKMVYDALVWSLYLVI